MGRSKGPLQLLDNFYLHSGESLTVPIDANGYYLTDNEGVNVEIDPGSHLGYENHELMLRQIDRRPEDTTLYLGTHGHLDHIAYMSLVKATLYLHKDDIGGVKTQDPLKTAAFLYENIPFPKIEQVTPIDESFHIKIGRMALQAIHTPGHTPGSMSYIVYHPEGNALIAGDTLWGMYCAGMGSDLDAWHDSLVRLQELVVTEGIRHVTFGHGPKGFVSEDPIEHIDKALKAMPTNLKAPAMNPWRNPYEEWQYEPVEHEHAERKVA